MNGIVEKQNIDFNGVNSSMSEITKYALIFDNKDKISSDIYKEIVNYSVINTIPQDAISALIEGKMTPEEFKSNFL